MMKLDERPIAERERLLESLEILRDYVAMPSTLTNAKLKKARDEAQNLGDRCMYYIGWSVGRPESASATAEIIYTEMEALIERIRPYALGNRKRGRQSKVTLYEHIMVVPFVALASKGEQSRVVDDFIKNGMLEKKKSTQSHLKRLLRASQSAAKLGRKSD
jgi:hypothetical protein